MNNIVDLRKHNTNIENQETSEQSERKNHLTEENIRQYINPLNIVDLRNLKKEKENIEEKNAKEEETYLTEEDILEGINSQNITPINPKRRQLLKFLLVGSGAFALGLLAKSLGFSGLFSKSEGSQTSSELKSEIKSGLESGPQKEADFKNWRIIEHKEQLVFIDKKTNENILILDL